jgi:hypothetical protein
MVAAVGDEFVQVICAVDDDEQPIEAATSNQERLHELAQQIAIDDQQSQKPATGRASWHVRQEYVAPNGSNRLHSLPRKESAFQNNSLASS